MKWRCHCGVVIEPPENEDENARKYQMVKAAYTHEQIHAIAVAIEAGKLPFYDLKLLIKAWEKHCDSVREETIHEILLAHTAPFRKE